VYPFLPTRTAAERREAVKEIRTLVALIAEAHGGCLRGNVLYDCEGRAYAPGGKVYPSRNSLELAQARAERLRKQRFFN
jgi:hypothetical protein